jgi:hypothetical protein
LGPAPSLSAYNPYTSTSVQGNTTLSSFALVVGPSLPKPG